MNRGKYIYCIDNLYKKCNLSRYNFIKEKYGIIMNNKLTYRFNRYSKKSYIEYLLLANEYFNSYKDKDKNIIQIIDNILEINPHNYKRYINDNYLENF